MCERTIRENWGWDRSLSKRRTGNSRIAAPDKLLLFWRFQRSCAMRKKKSGNTQQRHRKSQTKDRDGESERKWNAWKARIRNCLEFLFNYLRDAAVDCVSDGKRANEFVTDPTQQFFISTSTLCLAMFEGCVCSQRKTEWKRNGEKHNYFTSTRERERPKLAAIKEIVMWSRKVNARFFSFFRCLFRNNNNNNNHFTRASTHFSLLNLCLSVFPVRVAVPPLCKVTVDILFFWIREWNVSCVPEPEPVPTDALNSILYDDYYYYFSFVSF